MGRVQLKLIGASAQWYASRPGVDLLLRYYQEAASQFGLKLASEPRLYPEAKQGAKEALCYEALVKLDGYEDKAVPSAGVQCPGNADGGDAVAMFIDKETLIHFFDPNFGEFVINKDRNSPFFLNYVDNVLEGHLKWKMKDALAIFIDK